MTTTLNKLIKNKDREEVIKNTDLELHKYLKLGLRRHAKNVNRNLLKTGSICIKEREKRFIYGIESRVEKLLSTAIKSGYELAIKDVWNKIDELYMPVGRNELENILESLLKGEK